MLNRVDPSKIDNGLQEAVAEGLLGRIFSISSGAGEIGQKVIGSRPSRKFVTGFLEPAYVAAGGNLNVDETANPIHIITNGFDLQLKVSERFEIKVSIAFSVYVRVLPTSEDLRHHKSHIELTPEAKQLLRASLRSVTQKFYKEEDGLLEEDSELFYKKLNEQRSHAADAFFASYGVDRADLETAEGSQVSETEEIQSEQLGEGESVVTTETNEEVADVFDADFLVYPGSSTKLPAELVKSVKPVQKWIRLDFDLNDQLVFSPSEKMADIDSVRLVASRDLNENIQKRLLEWLKSEDPDSGGKLWAYPAGLSLSSEQIINWDETLKSLRGKYHEKGDPQAFALPTIQLEWIVDLRSSLDQQETSFLHLALENTTDAQPARREETEESIFLVDVFAKVPKKNHVPLKLERIKSSYRYNKYLRYPAIGFNSGVEQEISEDEIQLKTTWIPIYRQPRIRPRDYSGLDVSFDTLRSEEGVKALRILDAEFDVWIDTTQKQIDPREDADSEEEQQLEAHKFDDDLKKWNREKDKICKGIDLLISSAEEFRKDPKSTSSIPFFAWSLMNETMRRSSRKSGYDSWRLFQVAFILSNISGFASRLENYQHLYDEDWDESVVLLYFATGGGKTEAFFGLLVYVLFLDRLRGKQHGVSAMLRYPLRLLTVQQAQRLSKILALAEQIRWANDITGAPFEIGFWVGGGNTPNRRSQISNSQIPFFKSGVEPEEHELLATKDYRYAMENWNKLPECPFCNSKTALRKYRDREGLIGHACTSGECPWNQHHSGLMKEPLPFYIIDDDIYDLAPSVLLGTIDKLALIGHSATTIRRVFGMFGTAHYRNSKSGRLKVLASPSAFKDHEEEHDERLHPVFDEGLRYWIDPYPSLIIQDETHLLEESLGTFSGIFQTLFEHALTVVANDPEFNGLLSRIDGKVRRPKIVAASATVMEPERQMEALYQREVVQFPFPGPSIYESFYAAPLEPEHPSTFRASLEDIELRAHRARLYASILTNGKPHTSTTVELLANFHLSITDCLVGLNSSDSNVRQLKLDLLANAVLDSPLATEYRRLIQRASIEDVATLIDLHRIALTYVTNKKGGDQIMAAENDTTSRVHADFHIDFDSLNTELISGAVESGGIEDVIRRAESRPRASEPLDNILGDEIIRSIVATSAISHGVDVNELNSMFFAGMPTDTAEYIQASSRIGRTFVGFSVLIPTPQRRRDRYILEVNDIYHRFLERMIRPAAVDRWAESAIKRVLPSIFMNYLIVSLETTRLLGLKSDEKQNAGDFGKLGEINKLISSEGLKEFADDACNFFATAIGLNHSQFYPSAVDQLNDILNAEIRQNLIAEIRNHVNDFESIGSLFDYLDQEYRGQKKSPMTSLRDVDPAGTLRYSKGTSKVSSEDAYEIIRVIRAGKKD